MTRVVPVAVYPMGPVDRLIDLVPDVVERVDTYFARKKEQDNTY